MHIGMAVPVNFPADGASAARIHGGTAGRAADGLETIQRLGQRTGEGLQFRKLMAGEQIGVTEASALETALEQVNGRLLFRKIRE
jgi:hypothetical protein